MKLKIVLLILVSCMTITYVSGQNNNKKITVNGSITDDSMKPISGALIFVDNINTGIFTDVKGNFKIKIKPASKEIEVFTKDNGVATAIIDGRTQINFKLAPSGISSQQLTERGGTDELVDIGYGSTKQKDLSTSVNKIVGEDNKYSAYRSIFEVLEGTPGVHVNGKNILIQGPSSIYSSNAPLFVVDGIIVSSIDDISPQIVESISVLKGASTAIYGARGASGVILISLKKGSRIK